ncbi:MAG: ATP-binding cassette domain-containing protein [Eggerthellaceae bacterium]|nr:ATP-binding cassette domain-containing protein [Eggerthellaceae bacterium]
MALLDIKGVSKAFDGTSIIENTSLAVNAGDTIAFSSPSGSGKSTMLAMAGLLLTPDLGEILLEDGTDALRLNDRELSRVRQRLLGFVFQSTQLVGSLRAIENVASPANFVSEKLSFKPEERAAELLERFGLQDRMYHYPYQLSVGQRRRVAVARAMLLEPKIIIADEPTNDLDEESATEVSNALFDYAEKGNALLYATHIAGLASRARTVMTLKGKTFQPAE